MANFKKIEVTGATKKEAMSKVADIFVLNNEGIVKGDATQAFRLWSKAQTTAITESSMNLFMSEYLRNKKAIAGEAYYITLESAVADTRERPYRFEDAEPNKGTRKYVRTYQIIDNETGAVIAETSAQQVPDLDSDGNPILNEDGSTKMIWKAGTKAQAKELVRNLYINGFRGNVTCVCNKQIVEGSSVVFTAEYAPSKSARLGTYLVFGIKNV